MPYINTNVELEKKSFDKFKEAFKKAIFKISYFITINHHSSFLSVAFLLTIELLQMLSFPLSLTVTTSADSGHLAFHMVQVHPIRPAFL